MEKLSEKNVNLTLLVETTRLRLTVIIWVLLEGCDRPTCILEGELLARIHWQLPCSVHLPDEVHMSSALLRRYQSLRSKDAA